MSQVKENMLQSYYEKRFDTLRKERKERFQQIRTKKDALAYVARSQKVLHQYFGKKLDALRISEGTLNPAVRKTAVSDGVYSEAVVFESMPGFPVSALIHRPEKISGRIPSVLVLCGHSEDGKNYSVYNSFCRTLADRGYLVLCPDPVGQGERKQFIDVSSSEHLNSCCCSEHNQLGKMLGLFNDDFAVYRVYEAMRSLDYLLSRPEADQQFTGVTGPSGGGTLSAYLWALDKRLTAAAPCCYLTTFFRNFDNELPVDSEQILPGFAGTGFEMADFLMARAPEPVTILAKKNDFFDLRGTRECFQEVEKIYRILGQKSAVRLVTEEGPHSLSQGCRDAIYRFFDELNGVSVKKHREIPPLPLYCSANGLMKEKCSWRNLPGIIAERANQTIPSRSPERGVWMAFLEKKHHVALPPGVPDYNILGGEAFCDGLGSMPRRLVTFGIRTDPGIRAYLHYASPEQQYRIPVLKDVVLYVAEADAETELRERFSFHDINVFALDVRGCGKSRPQLLHDRKGNAFALYGAEYFYDASALMLSDSLFGGRCRDILNALLLLRAHGAKTIHLCACGIHAPAGAFAAIFAPELCNSVELQHCPGSLREMLRRGVFRWPQSAFPRGMLLHGDLKNVFHLIEKDKPFFFREEYDDFAVPVKKKTLPF